MPIDGFSAWCIIHDIVLWPAQIAQTEGRAINTKARQTGQSSLAVLEMLYHAEKEQSEIYYVVHASPQIMYMINLIKKWADKCHMSLKRGGCHNWVVIEAPDHVSVIKVITWDMYEQRTNPGTQNPIPKKAIVKHDHYWEEKPLPQRKPKKKKEPVFLAGMPWPKGF